MRSPVVMTQKLVASPATVSSPEGITFHLSRFVAFLPIFLLLFVIGILKAAVIAPVAFAVIVVGNVAIVVTLYPCHVIWTYYCVLRTKKFGILLKVILVLLIPVGIVVWPVVAIVGTVVAGAGYGIVMPLLTTFEAVREGVEDKISKCLTDGTVSTIRGAFTIVRDFKDMCYHSYFSFMDALLEATKDTLLNVRFVQILGCTMAGILGVLIDVPMISLIVLYKLPIMLFKGWRQLIKDLIGRSGPFLESACVPFAGFLILLWPVATALAAATGILWSLPLGCYAAAVTYHENSTKSGILYVIAVISEFDEFTNDFLYLREGSCFPRPKYGRQVLSRSQSFNIEANVEPSNHGPLNRTLINTTSMKMKELKAVMIWDNFFLSCELSGEELVKAGAIKTSDLESWKSSRNKIINIGLPSYVFLQCFLRSIKSGSSGFVLRDNIEMTNINRPEGRIFDWFFEPMILIKEQIRAANLQPKEEAYLYKLVLFCEDVPRITAWQNGGVPPSDEVKKAQLEGLSRRLHGFTLTMSRIPTFRRRLEEVVKALLKGEEEGSSHHRSITLEGYLHYNDSVREGSSFNSSYTEGHA